MRLALPLALPLSVLLGALAAPARAQAPAAAPPAAAPSSSSSPSAPASSSSPSASAPAPAPAAPRAADAPVAPAVATPGGLPVDDPESQRLVNGAPLHNPNVAVHVVQKKRFADAGRHEFTLYPAAPQVNGRFTEHAGSALAYTYHLQENFGLQLLGQYNWYANESAFNVELINKVGEQAQAATTLLLLWGAQAGVEVTPLYGKFAFYENHLLQFSLVISGGAGVGSTRVIVRPQVVQQTGDKSTVIPARLGDTGTKFVGSVGGGLRVQFGDSLALRLELRDQVYTARVDRVDGCGTQDFALLDEARGSGQAFSELTLSAGCHYQRFDGVDPRTGKDLREDIVLGKDLVGNPSSDVLNNLGFYAGFSYLF